MAARFSEMALAVILGLAALWLGFNVGAALMLLVKGVFAPVLVPVLVPEPLAAKIWKTVAGIAPSPAEA